VRHASRVIAALLVAAVLGLAFHYYVRPVSLKRQAVVIEPGKWVWVECETQPFSATLEHVRASGIIVSVAPPLPKGLPCEAVGLVARDSRTAFLPFRTIRAIQVNGQRAWSNPFPM